MVDGRPIPLPDWLPSEIADGSLGRLQREWRDAAHERDPERVVAALEALIAHPYVDEVLYLPQLWSELAEEYGALGRFADAVEATWEAIEAGWDGQPDGRCDIARYLIQDGELMQAEAVYAAVRVDTPDDIWLYNAAGIEWSRASEPLRALTWLTEGIELAIADDDSNGIVAQMSDERRRCLAALGRDLDDLERRVDAFLESWDTSNRYRTRRVDTRPDPPDRSLLAYPWIPAHAWNEARQLWPHPASDAVSHDLYSRSLERELLRAGRSRRWTITIAPFEPDRYTSWCSEHGHDPAASTSPSHHAADLVRSDEGIPWPPAPHDRCWCGSQLAYADCCSRIAAFTAELCLDPPPIPLSVE